MVATRRSKTEEPLVRRLVRGAVGGVAAGLVFAAVTMWFADSTGGKAEMPLRMIATIVKGDQAMAAGTTSPALGGVVHVARRRCSEWCSRWPCRGFGPTGRS